MKHNVLQLIGSFEQGGSERQAVQLARLLSESGRYGVHIACLDRNGPLACEAERVAGDIAEFRLTSFYHPSALVQARRFARLLREREIHIIHTHDFYTNVFGMFVARGARVPVRVASRRETTGWRTASQKRIERLAYRLADKVLANCDAVRRQLAEEGVAENKIVVAYNGVDCERVQLPAGLRREEALDSLGLPRGDFQFVTIIANLRHAVKDHPTFLRAARRVLGRNARARFILAGEGELTDSLRAMARELGLEQSAFFIGRCERVAELLAISDVCVLSSKAEGFSNAILEYMAAARPVVATDAGGAREAIIEGETGYVVAVGDDAELARRVTSLLESPERARLMGERGRQVIEQKFSTRAQLERAEALYDELLRASAYLLPQALERATREGAQG